MIYLGLAVGLTLLFVGAELLVRGAVRLASGLGISPLVIGVTLVGFGTSAPELVTSIEASLSGAPGIALGNIVGSNIANILLIMGISALLYPVMVSSTALKRDGMVMLASTLVFAGVCALMPLGRVLGAAFLFALAVYLIMIVRTERQNSAAERSAARAKAKALEDADPLLRAGAERTLPPLLALVLALAGLGLLIVGASLLVSNAVLLAQQIGVSDAVIGLTIVAVGTSLPELVTSVIAAIRKESDVALGNIIGSNIYNLLGIGGVTALVAPLEVPSQIITFDNPAMILATLALVLMAWFGSRISRGQGAALLIAYIGYIWLIWP